jgi:hypothetical protein
LVSGEVGAVTDRVFCRQTFWAVQKISFIKWAGRAGQGSDKVFPVPELVAGFERWEGKRRKGMAQLK